jgi:hypothetical protein
LIGLLNSVAKQSIPLSFNFVQFIA